MAGGERAQWREIVAAAIIVVVLVVSALVNALRSCELCFHPSQAVGEIDAEGALAGVRADFLAVLALEKEAEELLALHLVFGEEVVGFAIGVMAVHSVSGADDVNVAEGDESKGKIGGRRQRGEDEGGNGGAGPYRLLFLLVAKPDDSIDKTHD